jgi:hypothetical protein
MIVLLACVITIVRVCVHICIGVQVVLNSTVPHPSRAGPRGSDGFVQHFSEDELRGIVEAASPHPHAATYKF